MDDQEKRVACISGCRITKKRMMLLLVYCCFFGVFLAPGMADDKNGSFQKFTTEDGLSLNSLTVLFQDSKGFLWIGGEDGLDRYDGKLFVNYVHDPDDPTSIKNNSINCIVEDADGLIWLGTEEGIDIYDPDLNTFGHAEKYTELPDFILKKYTMRIFIDKDGDIWFASYSHGMTRFNKESRKITKYLDKGKVFDRSVLCFFQDKTGLIYFGGYNGVKKIDPVSEEISEVFKETIGKKEDILEYIGDIIIDRDRNFWIASYTKGLSRYSLETHEFVHYTPMHEDQNSISRYIVNSMELDSSGCFWAGTTGGGLIKYNYDKKEFDRFLRDDFDPNSLGSNDITDVMSDRSGVVWLATKGGGLNKHLPNSGVFRHYSVAQNNRNSLSSKNIFTLFEDKENIIWIGTAGRGLNSFNRKTKKFKQHPIYWSETRKEEAQAIRAIFEDSRGRLWVGTYEYGLWLYDRKTGKATSYYISKNKKGIKGYYINNIMEDSAGDLWVCSSNWGLFRLDHETERWTHFVPDSKTPGSISSHTFITAFEDSRGNIWFVTGRGVDIYDRKTGKFVKYGDDGSGKNLLPPKDILSINEDNSGNIWLGTWGSGLIKLNIESGEIRRFRKKEGLPNDTIYGILKDENGTFWMSTNKGISNLDPESYEFVNYSPEDGLQNDEYNAGAYHLASNGEMLFGGVNGFNVFLPAEVGKREKNRTVPKIAFTDFRVFNKSIGKNNQVVGIKIDKQIINASEITLNYDQNFITFEFSVLDFAQPSKNQYAYKLAPLNKEWIQLGNRSQLDLTLNPGSYDLVIKGSNNDGVWNNGISMKIIVIPPFWETLWFRALIIVLVASLISGVVFLQLRNISKQRDRLKEQVADRTRDLNEKNLQLGAQTETLEMRKTALEDKNEELSVRNKEMESFCYTVSHDLRAPLRHINGYNDIIREMYSEDLPEEAKEYMGRINVSASRMNEMIESFLWLSRANKQEMNMVDLDLSKMADEVIEEIRRFEPDREIEIAIAPDLKCLGDIRLMQVVLDNLLGNAWKYTRKTENPNVSFFETDYKGEKAFCVRDNGAGFDQANAAKLFHAFERLHNDKEFKGLGIGLSTVDKIIRRHGGRVFAEGEAGKGASFYFTLGDQQ